MKVERRASPPCPRNSAGLEAEFNVTFLAPEAA
jgi:hypothetical protein